MQNFKKHSESYFIIIVCLVGIILLAWQTTFTEAKKGEGIVYEPYSGVTDHCVTDASGVTNRSLYDILQTIGTSKKATVKLKNDNESGTTTAYKVVSASGGDFSAYTNVYFEFEPGAMLESGVTLSGVTLPQPANIIAQPNQQIMSGTSLYFYAPGTSYPEWFGAKGDGSTTDQISIQNCFTSMHTPVSDRQYGRPQIYFNSTKGYAIDSGVTLYEGVDLIMDSPIIYTGSANEVALTIGRGTATNYYGHFKLSTKRSSISDWTSESNIGIRIYNSVSCEFDIPYSHYFTTGVQLYADTGGIAGNLFSYGFLLGNKYGLDIVGGPGAGYVNSNTHIGGYFTSATGINTGESRYGVRIRTTGTYKNNHNVFIKPIFELKLTVATPGESVPVLIESGSANEFKDCRHEGNSTTFARITAGFGNIFNVPAGTSGPLYATLEDSTVSKSNIINYGGYYPAGSPWHHFWSSGPLHKRIGRYDATNFHIPGVSIQGSGAHAPVAYIGESGVTPTTSYINIAPGTNYLGVYVDTTTVKSFVVRLDANTGYNGRFSVTCFDSTDHILGGTTPYYAQSYRGGSEIFSYSTTYGGQYYIGTDAVARLPVHFSVSNEVKKIYVMFSPGTAGLQLRQIDLFSSDTTAYSASAWSGIVEPVPGARIGTTSPTKWCNIYNRGDITYNATPDSGTTPAWVCVFRLDTTLNGAVVGGANEITVVSDSGVTNSDIIGVLQDNTMTKWTTVLFSGGTNYMKLSAALDSAAASGNTVYMMRWKPMSNLGS